MGSIRERLVTGGGRRKRSAGRVLAVAAVVVVGATAAAPAARAAGGEQGELLIKGPGTLYAGPAAGVSMSVAAGTTAAIAFEVRNTGTAVAQFNIKLGFNGTVCAAACSDAAVVTAGTLAVTPLASGPNGYFTDPIAPGAVAKYTLKLTPSKVGATPGDNLYQVLQLADTAGNQLGGDSYAYVNITRGKGTGAVDQFVSSAGTPATSGNSATYGIVSAASAALGKTFAYTVKLMNDSAGPSRITYHLEAPGPCASYFPIKVMQGSTNDTLLAVRGTFQTAPLAHGASVTLTLTGTSLPGGAECLASNGWGGTYDWQSITSDGGTGGTLTFLTFSPAAV